MTQNIETLKQIATRLGVDLIPVDGLKVPSHCLYVGGHAYNRYADKKLEAMTADEFRAIIEKAKRPTVVRVPFDPTSVLLDRRASRNPFNGHFRGGERTR